MSIASGDISVAGTIEDVHQEQGLLCLAEVYKNQAWRKLKPNCGEP
jgi:hypothetical protein